MKTIKIAVSALLIASLASCKTDKDKEAQVEENQEVQAVDSTAPEKARYADAVVTPKKPTMPENYEIDWEGVEADADTRLRPARLCSASAADAQSYSLRRAAGAG